jgi:hypothetical protein
MPRFLITERGYINIAYIIMISHLKKDGERYYATLRVNKMPDKYIDVYFNSPGEYNIIIRRLSI